MSWYLNMKRRNEKAEAEKTQHSTILEDRRKKLAALRNAPRQQASVLPAPPLAIQQMQQQQQQEQQEAPQPSPESGGPQAPPSPAQVNNPLMPAYSIQRPTRKIRRIRSSSASPRKSFGDRVQISSTLLGTGAFGSVFLGIHQDTGAMVAVKKIALTGNPNDETNDQIDELVGEIKLMRELHHPNIVDYYHAERRDNHLWIYLEFMAGGSLASVLKKFEVLSESVMKVYFLQVLEGMQYLHARNIVHRDIKADNILLAANGDAKLSDFGTSREFSDSTNLLSVAGTPWFMAPEVVKGVGHGTPADIWSLACTMVHLCTGKVPFGEWDNPVTTMFHIAMHPEKVHDSYEHNESLSPELKDVLRACLQYEPGQRATVEQLMNMPFFAVSSETGSASDEEEVPPPRIPAPVVQQNRTTILAAHPPTQGGVPQPAPLVASRVSPPNAAGRPATPPRLSFRDRLREETQNQQASSVVSAAHQSGSFAPPHPQPLQPQVPA